MIGDSNTDIGHIAHPLERMLEERYGYYGSGYRALSYYTYNQENWISGNGRADSARSHLQISASPPETWIVTFTAGPKGRLSPTTSALTSNSTEAFVDVDFYGRSIGLFYLAEKGGGAFQISIDGGAPRTIDTAAPTPQVRMERMDNLELGWHRLKVTAGATPVTLLGVESFIEPDGSSTPSQKALVHKWGRSGATTSNFAEVLPDIHSQSLRLLCPDVVILMLGTNNHNLAAHTSPELFRGIDLLIDRIRKDAPEAKILVTSTLPAGVPASYGLLKSYLRDWKANVEAKGAAYFDLHEWMGGSPAAAAPFVYPKEAIHFSPEGGVKVAAEFLERILALEPQTATPSQVATKGNPPLPIQNVRAWFAADGPAERDEEGRVTMLGDLSTTLAPERIQAIQPMASARPGWVGDAANGKPAIRFNGKSSYLRLTPLPAGYRAYAIVFCAKSASGPLFTPILTTLRDTGPGTGGTESLFSEKSKEGQYWLNGRPVEDRTTILADPKRWNILVVNCEKHGNAVGIGYTRLNQPDPGMSEDLFFDGDIAEVVFKGNVPFTEKEVTDLNAYFSTKYGIPLEQ